MPSRVEFDSGGNAAVIPDWVPVAGVGVIMSTATGLLAWRIGSATKEGQDGATLKQLDTEDRGLRQDIRDLRDELRSSTKELQKVSDLALAFKSSQDVVNVMQSKATESIAKKLDEHADIINDHSATLRILQELLTRNGLLK